MKGIWAVVVGGMLAWAAAAQAGSVDLTNVAADAKWVAHVDVDGARASPVVEKFFEQCGKELPLSDGHLSKLCQKMGLEKCSDLRGVTVYGSKLEPRNGVMIAEGKWNAEALEKKAKEAGDHKVLEFGKHKIHVFTAHKGTKWAHEAAGTLYKPDVLVLASSAELLKSAVDVLDGKQSNLATTGSPLAAKVSPGAIVVVRAVDLKDSKAAAQHPAMELIRSFDYEKGQDGGQWFGSLTVTADSKPTAERLQKVLEGWVAWLGLHAHKSPALVDMLSKVTVRVDGNVVRSEFRQPADQVVALMPEVCKAIHEHFKVRVAMMQHRWREKMPEHHAFRHGEKDEKSKCCEECPGMKGKGERKAEK